ncbi:Serine/threonine-protein kinase pkn1 [compost metagenome]
MHSRKFVVSLLSFLVVGGCAESSDTAKALKGEVDSQALKKFIDGVIGDLIYVEGGSFLMGDFGGQFGPDQIQYDGDADSKPLHEVNLTAYSMGRFKVTNEDFQFYLRANGLQLRAIGRGSQENWVAVSTTPKTPAHMDWYEAEQYCRWLADISELPFALPTEAQWEYAARSRGQYLPIATDDGTYKVTQVPATQHDGPRGINISTYYDRKEFAEEQGWKTEGLTPLPVDRFPPNPLGLYAMSDNGLEWTNDWYAPDYYKHSPVNDPQGPGEAVWTDYYGRVTKVVRGQDYANHAWAIGANVHRTPAEPHGYISGNKLISLFSSTTRCVVNSPLPMN